MSLSSSSPRAGPRGAEQREDLLPWVGLALVLLLFLVCWSRLRPTEVFGEFYDDSIYFSTAQALAEGRGYVLPSLPGSPPQTKYPPLYPWLLSWVWRWRPSFPENLAAATAVTALFCCWFLTAAFQCLRRLGGMGRWGSVLITGLCAFHPIFLALSRRVMSDIPFMALALTGTLAADSALRPERTGRAALPVALLAGLAVLTRTIGFTLVGACVALALYRRAYRQLLFLLLGVTPLVALAGLLASAPAGWPDWAQGAGEGFRQTWLYHTSYSGFWRLSVPDAATLWAMFLFNLRGFLLTPSMFCLFPPWGGLASYPGVLLGICLSVAILAGLIRQARHQGWTAIHFLFPFYAAVLLVWNYTFLDRALLLYLPFFYAGLWWEGRHLAGTFRTDWDRDRGFFNRALIIVLTAGLLAVLSRGLIHYFVDSPEMVQAGLDPRTASLREAQETYDWVRHHTSLDTRFVTQQDAALYLYTGRQAMWPLACRPTASLEPAIREQDLTHLADVARAIGARYWVVTEDDFRFESARDAYRQRVGQLLAAQPVVFRSPTGGVQVYDLAGWSEAGARIR